ncbi:MAG: universal stress protein [Bacteroidales bacterium]|nr:universal stress protein [Bacteroidales bacterium]
MNVNNNNILVPIDFNKQSLLALKQSYNLARLINLDITLLYVLEETGIFPKIFTRAQNDEIIEKIKKNLVELAQKSSKESGIKINTIFEFGKIYSKINEVAEKIDAEFIVIGTSNLNGEINNKAIGANAHRIIRSSKRPVISINGEHHYNGCRSILLPLDLSRETRQKVTMAIKIAKYFGSSIKVVSAVWSKADESDIIKFQSQIKQVKKFIEAGNIECSAKILKKISTDKSIVQKVLIYARKQEDIDLIMIMTQQETGFAKFFLGSAAQEIIRESEIPVMSIIPKEIGNASFRSF